MPTILELRPDNRLMNASFEKYQFVANSVVISVEKNFETEVLRIEPNALQDSWLEARTFAYHNHLYNNPFDGKFYFINKSGEIWSFEENGTLNLVHKLERPTIDANSLIYNPSLSFAAEHMIVASNGHKNVEFIMINDGTAQSFSFNDIESGIILDSVYGCNEGLISFVIYSIVEENGKKCSQLALYCYSSSVVTARKDSNSLSDTKLISKKLLRVKGAVECASFEQNGQYLHVTSQDLATFIWDSTKTIDEKVPLKNHQEINIPKYYWSQDEDAITVWVKTVEGTERSQLHINIKSTSILIKCEDTILISGESAHRVDSDLTTWTHEANLLKIELFKSESGLMWHELIKGDTGGECLPNEALAAEVHSRLAHLCSAQPEGGSGQPMLGFNSEQLEECDIQEKENIFQRIHLDSHELTHQVILGANNHILFIQKEKPGHVLCLRQDHDGCVWIAETDRDKWRLKHIATFPGFGYVAASKTNRKFCVSPPNGSYVAIVEHVRHIFVYEKPAGKSTIGYQHIVDLGSDAGSNPILGSAASDNYLYLLTRTKLYQLQFKSPTLMH